MNFRWYLICRCCGGEEKEKEGQWTYRTVCDQVDSILGIGEICHALKEDLKERRGFRYQHTKLDDGVVDMLWMHKSR